MSDISLDDPARRALIDWIVGALDELPKTIGEQGYRALAWFYDDDPVVQVFTDDPRVSCEVTLDCVAYVPSYASIPVYCWQTNIPCFVVWDGQRFLIDMRPRMMTADSKTDAPIGMAQDDIDEFNRLSQELIKQAAWRMADDADQMIALLAKGFADAVRQITTRATQQET